MPKYDCYVKMKTMYLIPAVEAKNEKEARLIANKRAEDYVDKQLTERCSESTDGIVGYELSGEDADVVELF